MRTMIISNYFDITHHFYFGSVYIFNACSPVECGIRHIVYSINHGIGSTYSQHNLHQLPWISHICNKQWYSFLSTHHTWYKPSLILSLCSMYWLRSLELMVKRHHITQAIAVSSFVFNSADFQFSLLLTPLSSFTNPYIYLPFHAYTQIICCAWRDTNDSYTWSCIDDHLTMFEMWNGHR